MKRISILAAVAALWLPAMAGGEWVPQAGLVWRPVRTGELKATVSKGFRNPTTREMYLYGTANHDSLRAERMMNYELAWRQRLLDGRLDEADDIFHRLTWLGECLPYWGDSHYADRKDYRHGTLQLNLEGGGIAQTLIFGMFGIEVEEDFSIRVEPHLPKSAGRISLAGLRLAGQTIDVQCTRMGGMTVDCGGRRFTVPLGGKVVCPPSPSLRKTDARKTRY